MAKKSRSAVMEIRVPLRDVGMDGKMFLAAYFTHAEAALLNFWAMRPAPSPEPLYVPIRAACRLERPLGPDETVLLKPGIDKIGMRSIGFLVRMESAGTVAAEVEITWQARDAGGEAVAVPEETRDWLYGLLD